MKLYTFKTKNGPNIDYFNYLIRIYNLNTIFEKYQLTGEITVHPTVLILTFMIRIYFL